MKLFAPSFRFGVGLVFVLTLATLLVPQSFSQDKGDGKKEKPRYAELFGAGLGLNTEPAGDPVTVTARLTHDVTHRAGRLEVTAKIAPGWHLYSVTQKPGGPLKTTIGLLPKDAFSSIGEFKPNHAPLVSRSDTFPDIDVEEHEDEVTWTADLTLAPAFDPQSVKVQTHLKGLVCKDACQPVSVKVDVVLASGSLPAPKPLAAAPNTTEPAATAKPFRAPLSHATLTGTVEATGEGNVVVLKITASIEPDWHIYGYRPHDFSPERDFKPTLFVINGPSDYQIENVTADKPPTSEENEKTYHHENVTWTVKLKCSGDRPSGLISGYVAYQTCWKNGCDPPTAALFEQQVALGTGSSVPTPLSFKKAKKYEEIAALVAPSNIGDGPFVIEGGEESSSLAYILLVAFGGGFILNFMPCVLPVIGLKVMSFVQQAGESRARVFMLNAWYCAGLLSVFLGLATLVVLLDFGWGMQNQSTTFSITMLSVVFVMALSFLGVWEIPIPGFVGSGSAADLAEKEGPAGAFFKGIVTTILAVPCSGPGVATAFAWTNGKPWPMVFAVFVFMALGMACPYLLIGANPSLVRFLPKPGMWMETFKEVLGFVLLATVVFMLTTIPMTDVVPTIALLFALWAACWWGGRTPFTADLSHKLAAWLGAAAFAGIVGWFSFTSLQSIMESRFEVAAGKVKKEGNHWQPFSRAKLDELSAQRKTVMVDFTADWCATCKVLEATVLNTPEIRDAIKEHQVETMIADWTRHDDEITKMLDDLKSKQIPVLAIFPAGRPNRPIVLRGLYTKATLKEKLAEATATEAKVVARSQ